MASSGINWQIQALALAERQREVVVSLRLGDALSEILWRITKLVRTDL